MSMELQTGITVEVTIEEYDLVQDMVNDLVGNTTNGLAGISNITSMEVLNNLFMMLIVDTCLPKTMTEDARFTLVLPENNGYLYVYYNTDSAIEVAKGYTYSFSQTKMK